MADYYDTAAQGIDQGKAALLQAIASQGSQANQALQAGQDRINAAKQAALQSALAGGQQRGAPQAELDQISQTVGRPYDMQLSSLAASQATRGAGFDQLGASAGNYMDQAKAALPALRSQLAQKVAQMQASAQSQAMKDQSDQAMKLLEFQQGQALKGLDLQIAQANLAKAQQANTSPSKILSDVFGGPQGFATHVASKAGDYAAYAPDADPAAAGDYEAEALGQNSGLPAGLGSNLFQSYMQSQAAKNAPSPGSADAVRSDPNYSQAVNDFLQGAARIGQPPAKGSPKGAKPLTDTDVFNALVQHYGPDVARQVIGDYSRALPAASTLP